MSPGKPHVSRGTLAYRGAWLVTVCGEEGAQLVQRPYKVRGGSQDGNDDEDFVRVVAEEFAHVWLR